MSRDPLPNTEEHNQKWRELQQAYADAMWVWAAVECELFVIYVAAIGLLTGDMRPLRAAFFSINSFEMRLTMTHAAVEQKWGRNSNEFLEWKDLRRRCDKAAGQRGRIGHKTGTYVAPDKPGRKPLYILADHGWHHNSPMNWGTAKSTGIDVPLLESFTQEWVKINSDLTRFGMNLWKQALSPASPVPQADQSHPQSNTDDQNPKEPQLPPVSSQG